MTYQRLNRYSQPSNFRGRSALIVQLWWLVQATLFSGSPQVLYGWRRFLLRLFGAKIGAGVLIRPSAKVVYPWNLSIGDHVWIGDQVELYSIGNIQIGDHVVVSQRSYICTGSHDFGRVSFDVYAKPVVIEPEVWLAADVFVSPGVTIGRGAVVGARSTVFCDMPAGMICAGYPAKPLRPRVMSPE